MTETIRVNVDVTNPGQFFACCGLLELAHRQPEAEVTGYFTPPRFQRSQLRISAKSEFSIGDLLKQLLNCNRGAVDPYRPIMGSDGKPVKDANKIKPVMFDAPILLRISWWLDELAGKQSRFKTWSAHKTSEGLVNDMANAISANDITEESVFQQRVGMTSRLGLDPRSSWNTLDTGFSPNDQKLAVDTYPATELLAAIGLETFRPWPSNDSYIYATWSSPLPVIVARAAASGSLDIQGTTRYRFEVASRGRFKYFTKASLAERTAYD
jgi:CRISPR-associated protein Csx14